MSQAERHSRPTRLQLRAGNPLVQAALDLVDRRQFVPKRHKAIAYMDRPVPIAEGSSVSQPSLVADMIDATDLKGNERVLEIGTASGYEAAVLSLCAACVDTVEYNPGLAAMASRRLSRLGFTNVDVHLGDGAKGLPGQAPFEVIIVSAGCREVPAALSDQLAVNGRMVLPVGKDPQAKRLVLLRKGPAGLESQVIAPLVFFLPLISSEDGGWTEQLIREAFERKIRTLQMLKESSNFAAEALRVRVALDMGIPPDKPTWDHLPLPDSLYETSANPIDALIEQYPFLKHFLRNYPTYPVIW